MTMALPPQNFDIIFDDEKITYLTDLQLSVNKVPSPLPYPFVFKQETLEELLVQGLENERIQQEEQVRIKSPQFSPTSEPQFTWDSKSTTEQSVQVSMDGPILFVDESNDFESNNNGKRFIKFLGRPRKRGRKEHFSNEFELKLKNV
jgi:hypothetical protein